MVAYLFPGQGSQSVGMAKSLADKHPRAQETLQEADDALGFAISKLCFEGPEAELKRTEITQPAMLATSIAAFRVFRDESPEAKATFAAGHSLGEWSALVATEAISFADGLRCVRERGRLMQAAVPEGQGKMAAVVGLAGDLVADACRKIAQESKEVLNAANFNSPEQTVVSGSTSAVSQLLAVVKEAGAKKSSSCQ